MTVPFLCLCHCLSGGLPRDLIRIARELLELSQAPKASKKLPGLARALITRDMDRKRRAIAFAAAGIELEPQAGQFLNTIQAAQAATTSGALMAVCRTLTQDAPQDDFPDTDAASEARLKLTRLRLELATYYYHCGTIMQFFSADLTKTRLRAAEEATGDNSIEHLALARQAFAVSPQVTWSMSTVFRDAYSWDVLSSGGQPGEAAARAAPPGAREATTAYVFPATSG